MDNINDLASRVVSERTRRFGSKRQAYEAAGINSATWDRIEAGQTVREDSLASAVRVLWPHTGGDWRLIDESGRESTTVELVQDAHNRAVALARFTDEELLGEIAARMARYRMTT